MCRPMGYVRKNALELAMQQYCTTSCTNMLPVLVGYDRGIKFHFEKQDYKLFSTETKD